MKKLFLAFGIIFFIIISGCAYLDENKIKAYRVPSIESNELCEISSGADPICHGQTPGESWCNGLCQPKMSYSQWLAFFDLSNLDDSIEQTNQKVKDVTNVVLIDPYICDGDAWYSNLSNCRVRPEFKQEYLYIKSKGQMPALSLLSYWVNWGSEADIREDMHELAQYLISNNMTDIVYLYAFDEPDNEANECSDISSLNTMPSLGMHTWWWRNRHLLRIFFPSYYYDMSCPHQIKKDIVTKYVNIAHEEFSPPKFPRKIPVSVAYAQFLPEFYQVGISSNVDIPGFEIYPYAVWYACSMAGAASYLSPECQAICSQRTNIPFIENSVATTNSTIISMYVCDEEFYINKMKEYAGDRPWMVFPFVTKEFGPFGSYPSIELTNALVNRALQEKNVIFLNWFRYDCPTGAECQPNQPLLRDLMLEKIEGLFSCNLNGQTAATGSTFAQFLDPDQKSRVLCYKSHIYSCGENVGSTNMPWIKKEFNACENIENWHCDSDGSGWTNIRPSACCYSNSDCGSNAICISNVCQNNNTECPAGKVNVSRAVGCYQNYQNEQQCNIANWIQSGRDCSSNDYPNFSNIATDSACCPNQNSCIYNGQCYWMNLTRINGEEVMCISGRWIERDSTSLTCTGTSGCANLAPQPAWNSSYKWIAAGASGVGEYDNSTVTECCGDDANEYITISGRKILCCNYSRSAIENGKCITIRKLSACGNKSCDQGENCGTCAADCSCREGMTCYQDECHLKCENDTKCPKSQDCLKNNVCVYPKCGDGECTASESCGGCPVDCGYCGGSSGGHSNGGSGSSGYQSSTQMNGKGVSVTSGADGELLYQINPIEGSELSPAEVPVEEKTSWWIWLFIGLGILVVAGIVIFFVFRKSLIK